MSSELVPLLLRVGGVLILICGLILGLISLVRRLRPGLIPFSRTLEMRLVGMMKLGTRHTIAVVEIQDQWLIIGISPENISLLHTMKKPSVDENLKDKSMNHANRPSGFMKIFKSKLTS